MIFYIYNTGIVGNEEIVDLINTVKRQDKSIKVKVILSRVEFSYDKLKNNKW